MARDISNKEISEALAITEGTVKLRLYRYVAAIADELNFTHAAEKLHVAQSALSRQIRQLENYLGIRLFERDSRGVRLTVAGEAFAAEARLTLFMLNVPSRAPVLPKANTRGLRSLDIHRSSTCGFPRRFVSTCLWPIQRQTSSSPAHTRLSKPMA